MIPSYSEEETKCFDAVYRKGDYSEVNDVISAWLFFKATAGFPHPVAGGGRRVTRGEWRVLGDGQGVASDGWEKYTSAQPSKNRFNVKF